MSLLLLKRGNKVSVPVIIGAEKLIDVNQKPFLVNKSNKQRFMDLLSDSMEVSEINVYRAVADADVLIVNVALERARSKPTVVIGNDSDLIVLLLYKFDADSMEDIIVHSKQRIISIRKLKIDLLNRAPDLIDSLLFLHAVSGCDTCSSPLGVGKVGIVAKLSKLSPLPRIFIDPMINKEEVIEAGEQAMCIIYGIGHNNLDLGRSEKYRDRVVSATKAVEIQNLPPTSNACQQHSLRVYHQIQEWLENHLPPTEYGWEERVQPNGKKALRPVRITKSPASSELLKIIRCGCTQNACVTNQCSCYKMWLYAKCMCYQSVFVL